MCMTGSSPLSKAERAQVCSGKFRSVVEVEFKGYLQSLHLKWEKEKQGVICDSLGEISHKRAFKIKMGEHKRIYFLGEKSPEKVTDDTDRRWKGYRVDTPKQAQMWCGS